MVCSCPPPQYHWESTGTSLRRGWGRGLSGEGIVHSLSTGKKRDQGTSAGWRRNLRTLGDWSVQEGLRWGKVCLWASVCVHTCGSLYLPRGGMQPPSFVSGVQPQNMQTPCDSYIDRNPSGSILSCTHLDP